MTQAYADAVRAFWALYLGSKITSDGSVPGFNRWWTESHEGLRKIGQRMASECGYHADRGAPADQVVIPAVAQFRRAVQQFVPPRHEESPPAWASFCGEIFARVMDNGWKPPHVLQALYGAEERFVALGCPIREWIADLEAMGEEWQAMR